MSGLFNFILHDRWFKWVIVLIFFFLLGTRGLNEPDEGRYAEIGREMLETGDWVLPTLWYVPHLEKPPFTYWLTGAAIAAFGINDWAIRLPFALSGLSGAWAVFLLGSSLGGQRVGKWAALILSCSLLYFAIARMAMTDIVLLQFVCWAVYFGWRAWRSLDEPPPQSIDEGEEDPDFSPDQLARGRLAKQSFLWQLAAWVMCAGGFLTKGPLVFPLVAFALVPLLIRHRSDRRRLSLIGLGLVPGITLWAALTVPWFAILFERLPGAFEYMVGTQAGHALDAASKNRGGPIYFFVPILLFGFLPWTILLGWLWRKDHWANLSPTQKDGWLMLSSWAVLTFVLFSLNSAKLPHYILPMMPALALLVALRWPDWKGADLPRWVWRVVAAGPFIVMLALAIVYRFVFRIEDQDWIYAQAGVALLGIIAVFFLPRHWDALAHVRLAVLCSLLNLFLLVAVLPTMDHRLRSNQTLDDLGAALRAEYRPEDQLVIYRRLPQGLPLYAWPVINQTNRPWFAYLPEHRAPNIFPQNRESLAPLTLPNLHAITAMSRTNRVLIVGWHNSYRSVTELLTDASFSLIAKSGHWELFQSPARSHIDPAKSE